MGGGLLPHCRITKAQSNEFVTPTYKSMSKELRHQATQVTKATWQMSLGAPPVGGGCPMDSLWSERVAPVYKPTRLWVDSGQARLVAMLLIVLSGTGMGAGCSQLSAQVTATGDTALPAASQLRRQLVAAIGDARCNDDAQCHSLGVGSKDCGGPLVYLAWSSLASQSDQLQALALKLGVAERKAGTGMVSNCAVLLDPGARCLPRAADDIRVCRLNQRGPSANPAARE